MLKADVERAAQTRQQQDTHHELYPYTHPISLSHVQTKAQNPVRQGLPILE